MIIDELRTYGVDIDTALQRCVNNEALFIKLAKKIPDTAQFNDLKDALKEKDLDKAFDIAHALKGIVSNLAITPLEKPISEMTELLRERKDIDYSQYIEEMDDAYNSFCKIISRA